MRVKFVLLALSGVIVIAFALVFGHWSFDAGLVMFAPAQLVVGLALLGFAALSWHLDVPRSSPSMARDLMLLLYQAVDDKAEGAILFRDEDGWYKLMADNEPEGQEEFLAVYDRVEYESLLLSIADYLLEPETEFIRQKYLPKGLIALQYTVDEERDAVFRFERPPEEERVVEDVELVKDEDV